MNQMQMRVKNYIRDGLLHRFEPPLRIDDEKKANLNFIKECFGPEVHKLAQKIAGILRIKWDDNAVTLNAFIGAVCLGVKEHIQEKYTNMTSRERAEIFPQICDAFARKYPQNYSAEGMLSRYQQESPLFMITLLVLYMKYPNLMTLDLAHKRDAEILNIMGIVAVGLGDQATEADWRQRFEDIESRAEADELMTKTMTFLPGAGDAPPIRVVIEKGVPSEVNPRDWSAIIIKAYESGINER